MCRAACSKCLGWRGAVMGFSVCCCACLQPLCAVLCCAVLCCAVLCCAVLCCAVLCCAVLCCAVLCCAMLSRPVPSCALLLCAMLHHAVLCCPVLCHAVPLHTATHVMSLSGTGREGRHHPSRPPHAGLAGPLPQAPVSQQDHPAGPVQGCRQRW